MFGLGSWTLAVAFVIDNPFYLLSGSDLNTRDKQAKDNGKLSQGKELPGKITVRHYLYTLIL